MRDVLEKTPPELASDIIDRGIVMTGGGSLLRNLDGLLTQETGIACYVTESPLISVALGTGVALQYFDTLKSLGESPSTKWIFPMEFTNMLSPFLGMATGNQRQGDGGDSKS